MTNSRRTCRGPVKLMPGPGNGPRPGGWETLLQKDERQLICLIFKYELSIRAKDLSAPLLQLHCVPQVLIPQQSASGLTTFSLFLCLVPTTTETQNSLSSFLLMLFVSLLLYLFSQILFLVLFISPRSIEFCFYRLLLSLILFILSCVFFLFAAPYFSTCIL